MADNKIILGIDPGTTVMGFGVVQQVGQQLQAVYHGVLRLPAKATHALRLQQIFRHTQTLLTTYTPDEVALEAPFYGQNPQTMLKLGRAQGVAMAAALAHDIPVVEYAPSKVKLAITGSGRASKAQLAHTVVQLLQLTEAPQVQDAADALAVAICHCFQRHAPRAQAQSWQSFVQQHQDRVVNPTKRREPS